MTRLLKPGRELDKKVAGFMGWRRIMWIRDAVGIPKSPAGNDYNWHADYMGAKDGIRTVIPHYSTDMATAWKIVEKLAPVVGDFQQADGYFFLEYADAGDHSIGESDKKYPCNPGPSVYDDNENDLMRWSCHFHPGHYAVGSESEKLFPTYKRFCSRGETAAHAICLAALKVWKGSKRNAKT